MGLLDVGVAEQEVLHLTSGHVLATANDDVLDPSRYLDIPGLVHRREVAAAQPTTFVDGLGGVRGVVPVPAHHAVPPGAQLPFHASLVQPRLRADRRRLRHAEADSQLRDVEVCPHPPDQVGRAQGTAHEPGPQRTHVATLEVGVREFGEKHRGDPDQARAALLLDRCQHLGRVERRPRQDDRGAMRERRDVAAHHAEAMEQRDRDADPVDLGVADQRPHEAAVVHDVVMGERRPHRPFPRTAGVDDRDRVVGVDLGAALVQLGCVDLTSPVEQLSKGRRVVESGPLQVRRRDARLGQGLLIVQRAEGGSGKRGPDPRVPQEVTGLGNPERRINRHQDETGLGGGELGDHPLRPVGAPDRQAVPPLQTARHESAAEFVRRLVELTVGIT